MGVVERDSPDPREVVALLANPDTRRIFSMIALGQLGPLSSLTARDRRAVSRLTAADMLIASGESLSINTPGLLARVSQFSTSPPEGVDRFIRNGRIVNYPSSDRDRLALLEWVGDQVLTQGERVTEREIAERLRPFMDEHVLLRRYLVDYGVLQREPDGTDYRLTASG